jgi:hypothetical protein
MGHSAIALYLGETYATAGLVTDFNSASPDIDFEKSVFLPQISLKSLMTQVKMNLTERITDSGHKVSVFIVTKHFDRLKQFRLGGSIAQVIPIGFENSYGLKDSKSLSLAATQLIIPVESKKLNEEFLKNELERVKKINPDLNKVVISLPETSFKPDQINSTVKFFTDAGLKVFICHNPLDQRQIRKTLLNAGSEGTKEEILTEISETLGMDCEIQFFGTQGFSKNFENAELFNSFDNFFADYLQRHKMESCGYFDIETFKFIRKYQLENWNSPWGEIPIRHFSQSDLSIQPFSEIKLDQLSLLNFETAPSQLEPGPMVAGRAIKPLVLDLFSEELKENQLSKSIFSTLTQDTLQTKIKNIFSVLEKGQKSSKISCNIHQFKSVIIETLNDEIRLKSSQNKNELIGPLADLFDDGLNKNQAEFSWPKEIIFAAKGVQ